MVVVAIVFTTACSSATQPAEHTFAGDWQGTIAFTPAPVSGFSPQTGTIRMEIGADGAFTGAVVLSTGETLNGVQGRVDTRGDLRGQIEQFALRGELHWKRGGLEGTVTQLLNDQYIGIIAVSLARR